MIKKSHIDCVYDGEDPEEQYVSCHNLSDFRFIHITSDNK